MVLLQKKCKNFSNFNHEKISDEPKVKNILQNNWLVLFKSVKVMIMGDKGRFQETKEK